MIRIENDCVSCDIPCINCGLKHNKHYYCDECGEEDTLYKYEDKQLCKNCLIKKFDIVDESDYYE